MPIPVKVEFSIALAENMEPLIICVCGGAESGINTIWLREFKTLTVIKLGSVFASTILTGGQAEYRIQNRQRVGNSIAVKGGGRGHY